MNANVPATVRGALRRRGILLRDRDGGRDPGLISQWSDSQQDEFYGEMQRYSFRLVLRDVIRLGAVGGIVPQDLTRHASLEAVINHLESMNRLGLVQPEGSHFALQARARSLGPTLEWFVAEVLRRELGFTVAWSLPLRGGTTGGDLDVVACAEGQLLFVEVKSGPPKHLTRTHVNAFLERVEAIAPHGAIFFEDTELRLADKIVVMFEDVLGERGVALRPARLQRELFCVGPRIFLANAHPDVTTNLSTCVSHLLRSQGAQLSLAPDRKAR